MKTAASFRLITILLVAVLLGALFSPGNDSIAREPNALGDLAPADVATAQVPNSASPSHIAFVSNRSGSDQIWAILPDGSNVTQMTFGAGNNRWPTWAPDGADLAFQSDRDGDWDIYRTPGEQPLTTWAGTDSDPAWSPNGQWIAYMSTPAAEDIWLMNADGSLPHNITTPPSDVDGRPCWSPDSQRIAFTSSRAGWPNYEIYTMTPEGLDVVRLTDNPDRDQDPAWSPDGLTIAFASLRDGNWEVYVMNANGTNQHNISNHPADDTLPSWSPDGAQIAFTSNRDGHDQIYVMNADGSGQHNISNNSFSEWKPDWHAYTPITFSISGRVSDYQGDPVPGVRVVAGPDHFAVTDASGVYTITALPEGTYPVLPSYGCWTFSPRWLSVTVPPDAADQDFVGTPAALNAGREPDSDGSGFPGYAVLDSASMGTDDAALSDKPLAPNGVHTLANYESRIGEPGMVIEDPNSQMWLPPIYEEHSQLIFTYLQSGYGALSELCGGHDMPCKFSVEHYPEGSPWGWGGTDALGTIRYGYNNLIDDSQEWNLYGIPHVAGYYEEMGHSFVNDLGLEDETSVGFYETLGMMLGGETALRCAWNPHTQDGMEDGWQMFAASAAYYLEHDMCEPGIPENICLTRILAHIFKTEVIDPYGWDALIAAFAAIRDGYPLREYAPDHTWGGFLSYLSDVVDLDLQSVFAGYGLPSLQWTGEPGYERDGVGPTDEPGVYDYRVRAFDREGNQPADVALHLYGDGLWRIGRLNDSGSEFDSDPHDDPTIVIFTVGQPDPLFPNGLGTDIGPQRSIIDIHFTADLSAGLPFVVRWTPGGSPAVEQFSVSVDGAPVGVSQALSGEPDPYAYVTETFPVPPLPGSEHVIRLEHLMGDGLGFDVLQLGGCADRLAMSFAEGDPVTGWLYHVEAEVTDLGHCRYAFSANDGVHPVFQAVGEPTVMQRHFQSRVFMPLVFKH